MKYLVAIGLRLGLALLVAEPYDLEPLEVAGLWQPYLPLWWLLHRGDVRWMAFFWNLVADLILVGELGWKWAVSPLSVTLTGLFVYPESLMALGVYSLGRWAWLSWILCWVKPMPALFAVAQRRWAFLPFLVFFLPFWGFGSSHSTWGWPVLLHVLGFEVPLWLSLGAFGVIGLIAWRKRELGDWFYVLTPFLELHHLLWLAPLRGWRWHLVVGGFVGAAAAVGYLIPSRWPWIAVSLMGLLVWASLWPSLLTDEMRARLPLPRQVRAIPLMSADQPETAVG